MRNAPYHLVWPWHSWKFPAPMKLVLFGLLWTSLAGCSTVSKLFSSSIALNDLTLNAIPGANHNSPIAVELVATTDKELGDKLLNLTAAQWFDPSANWKHDYPGAIQSWYYEISPGQKMVLKPTEFSGNTAYALILYARYGGNGVYRQRLDSYAKATVVFSEDDLRLENVPSK